MTKSLVAALTGSGSDLPATKRMDAPDRAARDGADRTAHARPVIAATALRARQ
jgi:hypothetical protein